MRRLALSVLVMLAFLPLLWFEVLPTPAGRFFLDEIALFGGVAASLTALRFRRLAAALAGAWWLILSLALGFAVWAAASFYHGVGLASTAKQVLYLASFVVLLAVFQVATTDSRQTIVKVLRWSGVVSLLTLLGAFAVSSVVNAVQPLPLIWTAITTGNPDVMERDLFRPLFAGFGYSQSETVSQFRHEVFAGLLVALLVAAWARIRAPFESSAARFLYAASVAVGLTCIVLSLSRSVMLAAITWPVVEGVRVVVRGAITGRQAAMAVGALGGVAALMVMGSVALVLTRVASDSASYDARTDLGQLALQDIRLHPWSGGRYIDQISAHNYVVDAWLRGGVVMALLMAVALCVVFACAVRTVRLGILGNADLVPVSAAFALVLVRMLTIGGGLLQPAEWVALAFALAVSRREPTLGAASSRERAVVPARELQSI